MTRDEEILSGLWRFEARHPEWTEEEGEEDGWEPEVAWWAVRTGRGLVLIDPLVEDWDALDRLVNQNGGCAAVLRTCHWHERSVAVAAERYGAAVWAKPPPPGTPHQRFDHPLHDRDEPFEGWRVTDVERHDEISLWLPEQRALVFGDAMIRRASGELRVCPESWTQPPQGPARLREILSTLLDLPVEHVLVSHGPHVLGDGAQALRAAPRLSLVMDARDLYGLPLERFIPERKALAKELRAQGRRDEAESVAALRKPSLAAWGVNQLVRTQSRDVGELFRAGDEARRAQSALLAKRGSGTALREALDRERAAAERLARAARGLLSSEGHELSPAILERITETLHAAALEPEAREQVEDGCLDRELRHVGLDAAGLGTEPAPRESRRKPTSAPRAALRKREADSRRAAERASRDVQAAEDRVSAAAEELAAAKDALAEARRGAREAEAAHRRARRELEAR